MTEQIMKRKLDNKYQNRRRLGSAVKHQEPFNYSMDFQLHNRLVKVDIAKPNNPNVVDVRLCPVSLSWRAAKFTIFLSINSGTMYYTNLT